MMINFTVKMLIFCIILFSSTNCVWARLKQSTIFERMTKSEVIVIGEIIEKQDDMRIVKMRVLQEIKGDLTDIIRIQLPNFNIEDKPVNESVGTIILAFLKNTENNIYKPVFNLNECFIETTKTDFVKAKDLIQQFLKWNELTQENRINLLVSSLNESILMTKISLEWILRDNKVNLYKRSEVTDSLTQALLRKLSSDDTEVRQSAQVIIQFAVHARQDLLPYLFDMLDSPNTRKGSLWQLCETRLGVGPEINKNLHEEEKILLLSEWWINIGVNQPEFIRFNQSLEDKQHMEIGKMISKIPLIEDINGEKRSSRLLSLMIGERSIHSLSVSPVRMFEFTKYVVNIFGDNPVLINKIFNNVIKSENQQYAVDTAVVNIGLSKINAGKLLTNDEYNIYSDISKRWIEKYSIVLSLKKNENFDVLGYRLLKFAGHANQQALNDIFKKQGWQTILPMKKQAEPIPVEILRMLGPYDNSNMIDVVLRVRISNGMEPAIIPIINAVRKCKNQELLFSVKKALREMKNPMGISPLFQAVLDGTDRCLNGECALTIARINGAEPTRILLKAYSIVKEKEDKEIILNAISSIRSPEAIPQLMRVVQEWPDKLIVESSLNALMHINSQDAMVALFKIAEDQNILSNTEQMALVSDAIETCFIENCQIESILQIVLNQLDNPKTEIRILTIKILEKCKNNERITNILKSAKIKEVDDIVR